MKGPHELIFGHLLFEVLPEPFDWIQFWAVRREENVIEVAGHVELFGLVERAVVQNQNVQAVRKRPSKPVEEELVSVTIQIVLLQKKSLAGLRLDSSVEVKRFVAWLLPADRLGAGSSNLAPFDRHQTDSAFARLAKQAYRPAELRFDARKPDGKPFPESYLMLLFF